MGLRHPAPCQSGGHEIARSHVSAWNGSTLPKETQHHALPAEFRLWQGKLGTSRVRLRPDPFAGPVSCSPSGERLSPLRWGGCRFLGRSGSRPRRAPLLLRKREDP
jgi:hypothetical protein